MWREAQVLEERATVFIHGRSPGRQRAAEPCLCSRVRTRRQEGATCSRLTCYIFVFVVFVYVFVTIRDKGQHKFLWWKKISFFKGFFSDESLKNADNYLIDCLWQNGRVVQIWMELLCQAVKWFSSVCRTLGEGSPNTSSLHQATFIYQIWNIPKSDCTSIHIQNGWKKRDKNRPKMVKNGQHSWPSQ